MGKFYGTFNMEKNRVATQKDENLGKEPKRLASAAQLTHLPGPRRVLEEPEWLRVGKDNHPSR